MALVILQKNVPGLSSRSLDRFVSKAKKAVRLGGAVNVLVTGSAAIRTLNRDFRQLDKPTDVLSFPADANSERPGLAGEVAISVDIALQNAFRLGHSPAQEVKILALHGLLHLAGFDHERDNGEMALKEEELRRKLRLPVGLIERVQPRSSRAQARRTGRATKARGAQ